MSDKPRRDKAFAQSPVQIDDLPTPLNFLLDMREPNIPGLQMLSSLFLMGEAVARPYRCELQPPAPNMRHAITEEMASNPPIDDFDVLFALLATIREWSEANPRHRQFLNGLRDAIGEAGNLNMLFQNLFPQARPKPWTDVGDKPLLTPRQLDVLREVGKDRSQKEIAAGLGISVHAVNMHLQQVYKQLNCSRPMQAVTKAISLGYLDMEALAFIEASGGGRARDFHGLGYLFASLYGTERRLDMANLTPLAEFGLLLLALSASGIHYLYTEAGNRERRARELPMICELNPDGEIARTFGEDLPAPALWISIGISCFKRNCQAFY